METDPKFYSVRYHDILKKEPYKKYISIDEVCDRVLSTNYLLFSSSGTDIIPETPEAAYALSKLVLKKMRPHINEKVSVSDEDAANLVFPASSDAFYIENLIFRLAGGIKETDSGASVSSHVTIVELAPQSAFLVFLRAFYPDSLKEICSFRESLSISKNEYMSCVEDGRAYLDKVSSMLSPLFEKENPLAGEEYQGKLDECIEIIAKVRKKLDHWRMPW